MVRVGLSAAVVGIQWCWDMFCMCSATGYRCIGSTVEQWLWAILQMVQFSDGAGFLQMYRCKMYRYQAQEYESQKASVGMYSTGAQALVMSNVVSVAAAPEYAVVFLVFYRCVCV